MQVSIRVSPETGERLECLARKTGKTKTALILEALTEKYAPENDRSQKIHDLAGWMSKAECEELRSSVEHFNKIDDADWQ